MRRRWGDGVGGVGCDVRCLFMEIIRVRGVCRQAEKGRTREGKGGEGRGAHGLSGGNLIDRPSSRAFLGQGSAVRLSSLSLQCWGRTEGKSKGETHLVSVRESWRPEGSQAS